MTKSEIKASALLESAFDKAEAYLEGYFKSFIHHKNKGTIEIGGERYILIRASSLSVHFVEFIKNMYPSLNEDSAIESTGKIMFEMAAVIGKSDASEFHKKAGLKEPIDKLATGPLHFTYTGWALVELLPECVIEKGENILFVFDHHHSFEADSWISLKGKTNFCTCFMSAGYASGWAGESMGERLIASEILCRAKGDKYCRFVMAQPHRLEEFKLKYMKNNPSLFGHE